MKEVEVDGVIYEFPEDMSDAEILTALRSQFEPETSGSLEDVPEEEGPTVLDRITQTLADPTTGGMAGAVAGGVAGAPLGPPGILAGSALGAFGGGMTGEIARQKVAGEPAQPLRTLGAGALEGTLDITGAKAVDVIIGAGKTMKQLAGEGFGGLVRRFTSGDSVDPRDAKVLQSLFKKLEEEANTTLRPSQIAPADTRIGVLEATAEASVGGSPALRTVADRQNQYLENQIPTIVKTLAGEGAMGREALGQAIKSVIDNARSATSLEFARRFADLDQMGKGVNVTLRGLQARTRNAMKSERAATLSKAAQVRGEKLKFLSDSRLTGLREDILKLPPNVDFSTAYDIVKRINRKIDQVYDAAKPKDPIIVDLMNVRKEIQSQMKKAAQGNPELSSAYKSLMSDYNKTQNVLFSDTAMALIKSNAPEEAGRLIATPGMVSDPKMVKQIILEAKKAGVKEADKNIIGGIRKGFLEKHMQSVTDGIDAPISPFRRIENFKVKFSDPEFMDTFNVLFDKEAKDVLETLFKEAEILGRGTGGELALSVRSRQLGAATGAIRPNRGLMDRLGDLLTLTLPDALANVVADPRTARKLLNNVKAARSQFNSKGYVSPEIIAQINGGLAALGIQGQLDVLDSVNNAELEELKKRITEE